MSDPASNALSRLEPGLRRVLAPNPSPMTYQGTNSYIVGEGEVAVIDPGPDLEAHHAAILAALRPGERISHILVTHSHLDHSSLARRLAETTGAEVLGFGRHEAGRSPMMAQLAADGLSGGGEGADLDFEPGRLLADGDEIQGAGWTLRALHTPGHASNHLAFALGDALFTGDHVMGWASSMVSPPDGDLTAFMATCARLARRNDRIYYPGHGAPVEDPAARLAWLVAHRRSREARLLEELGTDPLAIDTLTRRIYTDTPPALLPAAARNVFAHLLDLMSRGEVICDGNPSETARFRIA
ncbi:MBL fold metallo-hydrolase [Tropicimonas sediminicola]|uniref:Hydroxyacylglutathione hydrolase n=1 Tax=Tropicimonas sediminicola TaxID=1031541 RepID=A0A239M4T9_9RHOB|nr:MBL fold metallo-hydrolase [Tropicimonas sediminicola]SNT37641.1 hydroxyacylglutathione hydrolase [Tropicimonas sediminicola]